jgi:hypothetical protein
VEYVELMYENEVTRTMDAIHEELAKMTFNRGWWNGFHWATVKGHIETAKAKLDKEPKSAPLSNYAPFD